MPSINSGTPEEVLRTMYEAMGAAQDAAAREARFQAGAVIDLRPHRFEVPGRPVWTIFAIDDHSARRALADYLGVPFSRLKFG